MSRSTSRLRVISAMLEACNDPDAACVRSLENGVALGLDGEMPRAPRRWRTPWASLRQATRGRSPSSLQKRSGGMHEAVLGSGGEGGPRDFVA